MTSRDQMEEAAFGPGRYDPSTDQMEWPEERGGRGYSRPRRADECGVAIQFADDGTLKLVVKVGPRYDGRDLDSPDLADEVRVLKQAAMNLGRGGVFYEAAKQMSGDRWTGP